MHKLDIGLKVLINSYITDVRKHISTMRELQEVYYNNYIISTKSKLKDYYYNKHNDISYMIFQYQSLIDVLINFIMKEGEKNK